MARYSILMVTLFLLILNATQECSAELDYTKSECLSTMQGIKNAMESLSNATHENFRFQRENQGSMNTLTDLVLQLKEQIAQQNVNIESFKNETTDLQRIDTITQENQDLRTMLETKDTMVATLAVEIQDLKEKLETKDKMVKDLEEKLSASLQQLDIHSDEKKLNSTVETQKKEKNQSLVCSQPELQAVKTVVQQFNSHKDIYQLGRDLVAVMDHDSEVYKQLQTVTRDHHFMFYLGYSGHIELVSLMLCTGLNVDTGDLYNNTMLHGAAMNGKAPLVTLLLDLGATVDVPGQYQYTALTWAAYYGHLDVVKLLVQAGASTTVKEENVLTPLEVARRYGTTAMAEYLQQFPH